ncbi:acetylglutamate semialdehyde dehydrogenase [Metasolibacillus sp.]|uniref:acetylglutamate semialdehyde dehydrogenase n=1 Tax=Metasolibacillus sp. TaxID=2703680 RepID=UPI0025ED9F37|nr:acetylglutamate semialdehyde dehydrogenase [Metasolibacillus sp.]MCT6925268.1 acetylglutamate semialdehyde dehydrogenase [Metasolibacillus sp.]MCT6941502.1 acetylglutamate semialdehyde dehydrogenase [Metasolibacillus sp.]
MNSKSALAFKEYLKICEEEGEDVLDSLKFSSEDSKMYSNLLDVFIKTNSSTNTSTATKGKALENLVEFIFEKSNIFTINKNVRTSTNEIDLLVKLNKPGIDFMKAGYISLDNYLLCECKNYNKTIGVTWTGKFYSLLKTSKKKIGIIFSYHGLSGKSWSGSSGLVRKINLLSDNTCKILSFSLPDFKLLEQGYSFASIIERKIEALDNDTALNDITSHELEANNPFISVSE